MCAVITVLSVIPSLGTQAAEELSLTLDYGECEDVLVSLYYVADVSEDLTFTLAGGFKNYPVKLNGVASQDEWKDISFTLAGYAAADKLVPLRSGSTDGDGRIVFDGLQRGMYLVPSAFCKEGDESRVFDAFLTVLPGVDENGEAVNHVNAIPKGGTVEHEGEKKYKIVKQWKDHAREDARPSSVTVDILKDGEVYSTQILSAENSWTYSWDAPDDGSLWQAVERDVAENYTVVVEGSGQTLVVVNNYEYEPPPPPQTGDTDVLWPYVLLLCVAGTVMIVGAAWISRRKA